MHSAETENPMQNTKNGCSDQQQINPNLKKVDKMILITVIIMRIITVVVIIEVW